MHAPAIFAALLGVLLFAAPTHAREDASVSSELAAHAARLEEDAVRRSLVTLEVTHQKYDWSEPWKKHRPSTRRGSGIIINGGRILTIADVLRGHTLVELRRRKEQRPWLAEVEAIDYVANLALLRPKDPAFLEGMGVIAWGGPPPAPAEKAELNVYRYNSARRLESFAGGIAEVTARSFGYGSANFLSATIAAGADGAGWGEPAVLDGAFIGLIDAQSKDKLKLMPTNVIRTWLGEGRGGNGKRDFATLGWRWQWLTNAELAKELGVPEGREGVLINRVYAYGTGAEVLMKGDVLLSLAGQEVDSRGNYQHPEYGPLPFSQILTEGRLAGDSVKAEVVRGGKLVRLSLKLAPDHHNERLVPRYMLDDAPRYLIYAGMLFQELSMPFLQTWGSGWSSNAPVRLSILTEIEGATAPQDRERVVVMTRVLPDAATIGYERVRNRVVERINGRGVQRLEDVAKALEAAAGEFLIVDFMREYGTDRLVLTAKDAAEAHPRILKNYQIPRDRNLSSRWAP